MTVGATERADSTVESDRNDSDRSPPAQSGGRVTPVSALPPAPLGG